jgi:NADH-quinone oxidoreductase subunit A
MLTDYGPILVLLALVGGFAVFNVILSEAVGRSRRAVAKGAAYECGMGSMGTARLRLSIHFYLVAVLFIVFDVETLLLVPWAVTARAFTEAGVGGIVFAQVALFLLVLGLGLVYEWRKGGMTWDR